MKNLISMILSVLISTLLGTLVSIRFLKSKKYPTFGFYNSWETSFSSSVYMSVLQRVEHLNNIFKKKAFFEKTLEYKQFRKSQNIEDARNKGRPKFFTYCSFQPI